MNKLICVTFFTVPLSTFIFHFFHFYYFTKKKGFFLTSRILPFTN